MSFTLSSKSDLATSLASVTASELGELLNGEASGGWTLDERIHETRKSLKRLRSLLRLYRGGLEHATFEREDQTLRDLGHVLAAFRNETALDTSLETIVRVSAPGDRGKLADHLPALRSALRASAKGSTVDAEAALAGVEDRLGELRERAKAFTVDRHGWAVIGPGVRRTYARGRRAFARALDRPGERRLHSLRTSVKRHQYQLELLEPLWPEPIKACRHEAKKLGELLGEEHDLSLLEPRLERLGEEPSLAPLVPLLKSAVEVRHSDLRKHALDLGARVYAESPGRFAARYREYFDAWP